MSGGSGLWGDLALLQLAVHWLLIEKLLTEGFQPIAPPLLVTAS